MGEYILSLMRKILKWAQKSSDIDNASYQEMKKIYEETIRNRRSK